MAHVTSSSNRWSSADQNITRGFLIVLSSGGLTSSNLTFKSNQYLLRSLYIHVTGNSKITNVHESTIWACGILWGAQIVSNGHGESAKAIRYLLRLLYIHVTGGNNGVWNIKERNRVEMSILWGNGNITGAGQACIKSNQYLLRPTLVRFIINISSS